MAKRKTRRQKEKKKESRQYSPRTGGIQMRSLLLLLLLSVACTAKHFYRLQPWLQDNRHFFLLSQASVLPFSFPFFAFHLPSSKGASSTLVSSVANPRRAKTDTSVPFRVYHQALLLIVGKYSDTVTRGEFHERSNLCAPQEHRVVTWA